MKRCLFLIICFLLIPTFAYADMPSSHLMKRAFQSNIIDKWYMAKGVMMLQDADGWQERHKIYEQPNDTSNIVREFTIKKPKRVVLPMEEYVKQSRDYIDQLPLFISTHGYDEQMPGYAIFIPIMDIQGKWALIYVDWNAKQKGWVKLARNYFLFDKSVDNIWKFRVKTFYYPKKNTVLRPIEPNKKDISIDASSLEIKSNQIYKNDLYIYVPSVSKILQNKIFTTWGENNYFFENRDNLYIFNWVYWSVGD